MPRAARLQFPGALYHVINRGNYRKDLFAVHKTGEAFEQTLFEACGRFDWRLHAYVVMSNHFHLALETPRGNLVQGMQWLQSVFANRFNRFCGGHGHVFQGRYKSLLVEPGASLCRVVDYIHLNPVRAGIVELKGLRSYRLSSFPRWFETETERPVALVDADWRAHGGYATGPAELRRYWSDLALRPERDAKLADGLRRELCRGWLVGSREYVDALFDGRVERDQMARFAKKLEGDARETESFWSSRLDALLIDRSCRREVLASSKKSAPWKLEIADEMKRTTGASNRWLANALHLGAEQTFSSNLSKWRKTLKNVG